MATCSILEIILDQCFDNVDSHGGPKAFYFNLSVFNNYVFSIYDNFSQNYIYFINILNFFLMS